MKIAFILTSFPEISETFIISQIKGLIEAGHDVKIFAHKKSHESKKHDAVDAFSMMDKTVFFAVPDNVLARVIKGIVLAVLNLHKDPLRICKALNVFKYKTIRVVYYLIPLLREEFDVFLCHYGSNGIAGCMLKEAGVSAKVVTVFHGNDLSEFVRNQGGGVYEGLFKAGDLFMPVSEHWRERLVEMGCSGDKIIVHHMGIDLEMFPFCRRTPSETVKLLSVGRLVEKKGHEFAIKAVKNIRDKGVDVKYAIIGVGPQLDNLKAMTADMGLEKTVCFEGSVTQEDILKVYREADIFILPSITADTGDKEGIPVALMEAMATGLPVLSTFHSGIPEIVEDGVSGFLVPEKDQEALSQKMETLLKDPDMREKMSAKGRERIKSEYDIKKLNEKLANILKELCK